MDVTKLSLEEAVELQKKLEAALPNLKKQRLKGVQAEIRELVAKNGFTLDEVLTPLLQNKGVEEEAGNKTVRKPAAIKYRLGDKTWTGKGKPPAWVLEVEKAEGSRESLRVAADSEQKTD